MEKVYLTNSNFEKVLSTFKGYTEKYNFILRYEEFYKNNELTLNKQIFKTKIEDPYKLYNSLPAYHKSSECENLKKDYENFTIDRKIPLELLDSYKEWL